MSLLPPLEAIASLTTALGALLGAGAAAVAGYLQFRNVRSSRLIEEAIERSSKTTTHIAPEYLENPVLYLEQNQGLLRQYHAQGLIQSNISFWFSIIFACVGFAIIGSGALAALGGTPVTATRAAVPITSGGVIDAVSALFFVQSNRARQLMSEFFDKLRIDNKLAESLRLSNSIEDPKIAASLKAYLSMHFAGIDVGVDGYRSVVGLPVRLSGASQQAARAGRSKQTALTDAPQ